MNDETGGDESRVREIVDNIGWFFEVADDKDPRLIDRSEVLALGLELFAAGRAAENEACEKLVREQPIIALRSLNMRPMLSLGPLADAIAKRRGGAG